MRYSVSGAINTQLNATLAATGVAGDATAMSIGQYVMGASGTSGRITWLRSLWAHNIGAITTLTLYDATSGGSSTATSNKKMDIACASGLTTMVEFAAPGLKFATSPCVLRQATTATSNFGAGQVGGAGYEE